jgi:hypothetical protein
MLVVATCAVAVMSTHAPSQEGRRRLKVPRPAVAGECMAVFNGIEEAWRKGDAQGLANYMRDSKVSVNVGGLGEKGGYYSKSQVFYLLKEMFAKTRHKRFQFVKYHDVSQNNRKVYGIAYRSYEDTSSGRLFQDKIYVTLKLEGERWVVSEMKSTR